MYMYTQSMFFANLRQISHFSSENYHLTTVQNCSILHRYVRIIDELKKNGVSPVILCCDVTMCCATGATTSTAMK